MLIIMDIEAEKFLVPNGETRTRKRHAFKYRIPSQIEQFMSLFVLDKLHAFDENNILASTAAIGKFVYKFAIDHTKCGYF